MVDAVSRTQSLRKFPDLHVVNVCSVSDVVRTVTRAEIPPHKKMLDLIPSFAEDEDAELVPPIRYML